MEEKIQFKNNHYFAMSNEIMYSVNNYKFVLKPLHNEWMYI